MIRFAAVNDWWLGDEKSGVGLYSDLTYLYFISAFNNNILHLVSAFDNLKYLVINTSHLV